MYKRRDWLHLHGQQAADAGSDDDSQPDDSPSDSEEPDKDERGANESSSGSSTDGDASSSEEEEDAEVGRSGEEGSPLAHRLEDLSEDDYDGKPGPDSEEEDEASEKLLLEQKQNWMQGAKADTVKGKPLTCMACKSVLLLNAESLRRHLASKKHVRQLRACQPGADPVRFAGSAKQSDPEVETHWERGARIGREAAATAQPAAAKPKKRKRRGGGAAGTTRKGKKPGKRQRQLLRGKES